ncbi:U3 small nucleolar RNA-associated protein 14 homolog A [Salvelinus sp. IW2-2015]|uniref:U3 small nucleolar RNA-associated protein 14 homolog A n=1 Tax=Salvelinus sp. IW2-2015 TaxID=2691554 RepID=UPI000CDFED2F|nr:U3 small nucleolar RNA-associated protein 14 homolog A [Salvelinus alpinus]
MAKSKATRKSGETMKMTSSREMVVQGMDDEDDEELQRALADDIISASEDEGGSDDERKHCKLLEAISSLGGKKRKKLTERSEASIQVSEFTVNAEGEGDKINLSDLIGTLDKTPSALIKTKKQLKNLQHNQSTLETPLTRKETEKIQREVAFEKTSKEVSRWQSVVLQNQKAEQLVFPLNQEPSGPKRIEQVVAGWKAQTPLEQEIFSLLRMNKQPLHDPVLTPTEEASLRAMSLEEAKIRRAELQKTRVLQSYYEAKAKREKKIKSKKYHRVQKKVMRKEYLKQFDEMVKTDPAAALEELKKMELSRMKERMSLKHQNSGKWAKSKAIMAKYDDGARKAMQIQLEVNKDLTQKLVIPADEDEEDEEDEEESAETLPDFVNDVEPILDQVNPWMRGKLSTEPMMQEESNRLDPPVWPREVGKPGEGWDDQEEDEEQMEETEEESLLRGFEERRKLRQTEDVEVAPMSMEENDDEKKAEILDISDDDEEAVEISDGEEAVEISDGEEAVEISDDEEAGLSNFTSLFHGLVKNHMEPPADQPKASPGAGQEESPALLEEGLVRVRTLEDVELLSQDISASDTALLTTQTPGTEETDTQSATQQADKKRKRKKMIDPNEVLTKEAKVIEMPLAPTAIEDVEDKEEQRIIIKEAFAGDDVISDFLKDKRKQEEAGRPKVIDLTLPGWGEWGGLGLQPSRSKRKRFRVKVAPPPPRQDQKLPNIIIAEKRDSSIAAHQVCQLPFPFENPTQFERTIRSPVGHTWNTQNTVQKITAPKVVTQLGAIIEPIAREDLIKNNRQAVTRPSINLESDQGPQKKRCSQQKKKHKRKRN